MAHETLSKITSKGQVTVPAEVRRHLGLHSGDSIIFVLESDGSVSLRAPKYPTISSVRGAAGSLREPMAWSDVMRVAREDAAEESSRKPR